jgi:hypothetical protein
MQANDSNEQPTTAPGFGFSDGLGDKYILAKLKPVVLSAEVIHLLTDVAQVFDGWHSDGTAWTEWDESVRKSVSAVQRKLYTALGDRDEILESLNKKSKALESGIRDVIEWMDEQRNAAEMTTFTMVQERLRDLSPNS